MGVVYSASSVLCPDEVRVFLSSKISLPESGLSFIPPVPRSGLPATLVLVSHPLLHEVSIVQGGYMLPILQNWHLQN